MSTSEGSETGSETGPETRAGKPADQDSDARSQTDKPQPDDSAKAKAKEMAKAYEDRPTAVLPGSDRTVTGTAINEWLDDDGQPIYGNDTDSNTSS